MLNRLTKAGHGPVTLEFLQSLRSRLHLPDEEVWELISPKIPMTINLNSFMLEGSKRASLGPTDT